MDLDRLNEAKGEKGDADPLDGEREKFDKDLDGAPDGGDKDPSDPEVQEENQDAFAPNHYCIHHGGVEHGGKIEMAEAVSHNYNNKLGRVTHYDMRLADGTVLERVAAEDIQVTNASLAEGHHSHPAKRDDEEEENEEKRRPMQERVSKLNESKIRSIVRKTLKKRLSKK